MVKIALVFYLKIRPIVGFLGFFFPFSAYFPFSVHHCLPSPPQSATGVIPLHSHLHPSPSTVEMLSAAEQFWEARWAAWCVSWTQQWAGDMPAPWEGCRLQGSGLRNQETCFNLGSAPHPNMYDVYGLNAITLLQESSPVVCISHKVLGVCD